jgi:hypothetical protein
VTDEVAGFFSPVGSGVRGEISPKWISDFRVACSGTPR